MWQGLITALLPEQLAKHRQICNATSGQLGCAGNGIAEDAGAGTEETPGRCKRAPSSDSGGTPALFVFSPQTVHVPAPSVSNISPCAAGLRLCEPLYA